MPISKGPNCVGDVMKEHKAGQLHSGKGGPKVKSDKQAKAIAGSMCHAEDAVEHGCGCADHGDEPQEFGGGCGGDCGCRSCKKSQKRKTDYMEHGFSESAADFVVFGQMQAPLGFPSPSLGGELEAMIRQEAPKGKRPKKPQDYFEKDQKAYKRSSCSS